MYEKESGRLLTGSEDRDGGPQGVPYRMAWEEEERNQCLGTTPWGRHTG